MKLWNALSTTFLSAFRHPWLWLLQFFGNAILVLLFVAWVRIDPATGLHLVLDFLVAIIFLFGALLLHGGTLNYYAQAGDDKTPALLPAFKNALRHLFAFAIAVAIFWTLFYFVDFLDDYQFQFPGYLRSEFPAWLRRLISEPAMDRLYEGFVSFLRWVVIPGITFPLWMQTATIGFRGFIRLGAWWRTVRSLSFWIVLIVAFFLSIYCGSKIIMDWKLNPKTATVGGEKFWLALRLIVFYLLGLFSCLWVYRMLARFRSQPDPPAASQKAAA